MATRLCQFRLRNHRIRTYRKTCSHPSRIQGNDMSITTITPVGKNLGNGHHILTSADFNSDSGQVNAFTTISNTNKLGGFHSRVQFTYFGDHGQVLGAGGLDFGIPQAPIIGAAQHSQNWVLQAPQGTQGLRMEQFWNPHWPLDQVAQGIANALGDLGNTFNNGPQALDTWQQENDTTVEIVVIVIVVAATALCIAGVIPACAVVITVAA